MEYGSHYSVLLNECIDCFQTIEKEKPLFVDLTFGAGGHSSQIAIQIPSCSVISTDQDLEAIENGKKFIESLDLTNRIQLENMNFEDFPNWFRENHPNLRISGIMMDLGVSSHQFDTAERGFSFRFDADLDMRMNQNSDTTAADVLNNYTEEDIANIIFEYGEDRLSRVIAKNIIEFRNENPIKTTKELENICFHSYPKKMRHGKTHPATRTFQALRIYVNRELEVLENTLVNLFDLLDFGGRLQVISFHSLEDRIVKHKFKDIFKREENTAKILTKKPIIPTTKELSENPRSRSAKLRIIEKLDPRMENGKKKWKKSSKAE